jgi:hypothetical protein
VPAGFFGAAQDALDMYLLSEADYVCRFDSAAQACSQVGSGWPVSGSVKLMTRHSTPVTALCCRRAGRALATRLGGRWRP